MVQTKNLNSLIKDFFTDYLKQQRNLSENTISSYKNTFYLYLSFLSKKYKINPEKLTIKHFTQKNILTFLSEIENIKGNKASTRNLRLAAFRCFAKYILNQDITDSDIVNKILYIPTKRADESQPDYLEKKELEALFSQIDTSTKDGFRDLTILAYMYNTGARASEVAGTKISKINFLPPYQVELHTKGRKKRICPLWNTTIELTQHYITYCRKKPQIQFNDYLFINQRRQTITRFGIRKIVQKYFQKTCLQTDSLNKKKISSHSIRHSTATHLLDSKVELNAIKRWLGHDDIKTTSKYLNLNLEEKRAILEKFVAPHYVASSLENKKTENILTWLKKS